MSQPLPLAGVRVIDFTQIQAGPQSTLWLAVMGAEVIKVESRQRPDLLRLYSQARDGRQDAGLDSSPVFSSLNLSKKNCTLNLTRPRARELFRELARVSDIVVENFSSGVMDRLGLDYTSLRAVKPDIIMVSVSGPGRTGPEKNYLAYAAVIHAFTGLCSLSGYPGGPPNLMGVMWSDVLAGQAAAFAALAALHHRERTGQGQYVDVSMSEATLATLPQAVMDYTMNGRVGGCEGNRDACMAPHGCYPCRGEDAWVAIAVENEAQWQALCGVLGNPAWTREERFGDELARWRHQEELDEYLAAWTAARRPREVMALLQAVGIAAGPSSAVTGVLDDPQLRAREFIAAVEHPVMGTSRLVRPPWRVDGAPAGRIAPSPLLGEHNDYVFRTLLGLSQEELDRLVAEQVVY